jgi:hypothetical protein
MVCCRGGRVKLPKSFLAVNLSEKIAQEELQPQQLDNKG